MDRRLPPRERWPEWFSDDGSSSSDDEPPLGDEAGEMFLETIFGLMFSGQLSAKSVCVLCYWAHKAGASERIGKVGFRPNASSTGHYQRHLDSVLQTNVGKKSEWHTIKVPSRSKAWAVRQVRDVPVLLPYAELEAEATETRAFDAELAIANTQRQLPNLYYTHPARAEPHGARKPLYIPTAMFVDGVPTIRGDGCIGFWLINLISQKRHLCCVLRKRGVCGCGCAGWCSYYDVLDVFDGRLTLWRAVSTRIRW